MDFNFRLNKIVTHRKAASLQLIQFVESNHYGNFNLSKNFIHNHNTLFCTIFSTPIYFVKQTTEKKINATKCYVICNHIQHSLPLYIVRGNRRLTIFEGSLMCCCSNRVTFHNQALAQLVPLNGQSNWIRNLAHFRRNKFITTYCACGI